MIKKLDWYTIRTYFGPFLFIFSVLFFIFMVQFAWQEMDKFAGKGLDLFTIFKLLFYLGLSVIQLVMPLTILLAAIMTFGGFGERYELAAMKSTGISLARIMMPLFLLVCTLSVGLYFFSDRVVPKSQRKAKNMLLNIMKTKPAVNFDPGIFIDGVPGFSMKIGDRHGKDGEFLKDVFIHKDASSFENKQTITSARGMFAPAEDKRFLKLALFDGYFYEDEVKNLNRKKQKTQPYQRIKFDTLIQYFDISEIVEKAIEKENITDHYKFMNTVELMGRIDTLKMQNQEFYTKIADNQYNDLVIEHKKVDSVFKHAQEIPYKLSSLSEKDQKYLNSKTADNLKRKINIAHQQDSDLRSRSKFFARHVLVLARNFSNSLMCIVFFLIGAPLGAIIRKGGIGMPVVVAIVIFILFYLVYMYSENLAKNAILNPYWAAWLPVILFFPLGIFFTYKAMTDSDLFDAGAYLEPITRFFNKIFKRTNNEHARYQ